MDQPSTPTFQPRHRNGHAPPPSPPSPASSPPPAAAPTPQQPPSDTALLHSLSPGGTRSLSGIATQAFTLGIGFAGGVGGTWALAAAGHALWRLPAFAAVLATFHFLEFWTTARFNASAARASSFLLGNGRAYDVAHALASLEVVVVRGLWRGGGQSRLWGVGGTMGAAWIVFGAVLVVLGQAVRSAAMVHAAANFSHIPAREHRKGHVLVTDGVYAWLRHPAYFGFFFWALGTQVLVGNRVCLLGYAVVLWRFFDRRIAAEERSLVDFFGRDYEAYRERVGTGIPFIR